MGRPREHINYERVALAIAWRRFPTLCSMAIEDVRQEAAMLDWEARTRGNIIVGHGKKRRVFGGAKKGKERMGLRSFSRAAYARLYRVARNYGYRRVRHAGISTEK